MQHRAGPRYWAFISYSHRDADWAAWLHGALERFRVPGGLGPEVPRRLLPVFRDREELPSAAALSAAIRAALARSRCLIVICSPDAARSRWVDEEIRAFKALGGAGPVLPLIVAGRPGISPGPEPVAEECFPPALRWEVAADESLTGQRAEPLAADIHADGRADALLKLVAGTLGLGLDALRQRERRRQRRTRMLRAGLALAGLALAGLAYVAMADLTAVLPGSPALRRWLDGQGITLFRPVVAPDRIATTVAALQQAGLPVLRAGLPDPHDPGAAGWSVWQNSQVISAILGDPRADARDLATAMTLLRRAFAPDMLPPSAAGALVWGYEPDAPPEVPLWTILALDLALRRLPEGPERAELLALLARAQALAERFAPIADGGWNLAVRQADPADHATFVTAFALHAMLALRDSGLGWRGDRAALDRRIAAAVQWLRDTFVPGEPAGWRRTRGDDMAPDRSLTAMVAGVLARAATSRLPAPIEAAMLDTLEGLADRPFLPASNDLTYSLVTVDPAGYRAHLIRLARLIWLPWSAVALADAQGYAARFALPAADRRALARSLGHVVVALAPQTRAEVTDRRAPVFVAAETLYGLSFAAAP